MLPLLSCIYCQKARDPNFPNIVLCEKCRTLLEPSPASEFFSSIYKYNDLLRDLILRVKIQGDPMCLSTLVSLLVTSSTALDLARRVECIVPAPSSLWARMRGRYDLAWVLAFQLAKHARRDFQELPFKSYLQFKKRAKEKDRDKVALNFSLNPHNRKNASYLLVDDVITSGFTFQMMSRSLAESDVFLLTLANAYSGRQNPG